MTGVVTLILEDVQAARERYMPQLPFDSLRSLGPAQFKPLKMALDDRQRNWLAG